jgi:hypothetical protein
MGTLHLVIASLAIGPSSPFIARACTLSSTAILPAAHSLDSARLALVLILPNFSIA